jgi:uncharacterized GH25 family protein
MRRLIGLAAFATLVASSAASAGDPPPAKRWTGTVDVVVADEDGRPVAAARVEAFAVPRAEAWDDAREATWNGFLASTPRAPGIAATTDANGAARLDGLPFGWSAVVVTKPGFAPRRRTVPAPGTDAPVRFDLVAGHPLEGRVLTDDGRPIAGALVVAAYDGDSPTFLGEYGVAETPSPFDPSTRTDAEGRWRFDALPQGEVAIAAAPSGTWTTRLDRVRLPGVTRYDFVLESHAPLAGTVRDKATGEPIADAVVDVRTVFTHTARTRVVSDARGRWSVPLFPSRRVEVTAKDYEPAGAKEGDGALDLLLERTKAREQAPPPVAAAWIRGIVVGAGRGVEIRRQGERYAASARDGTFVLPCPSAAGPVRVWAIKEKGDFVTGVATPATTPDEAAPVVLRWPSEKEKTFHVTGVVRPPDGLKLVRPRVTTFALGEDLRRERWTSTSPDGRFDVEFRESQREFFHVAATAAGCGVTVVEKAESGVELRLSVGAQLRGRVLVEDAPLGRASVRLSPADEESSRFGEDQFDPVVAVSADDGSFAAEALPAGRFDVLVEACGLVGAHLNVELSAGGTAVADAELVRPRELRGIVTWPDGSPVGDVPVWAALSNRVRGAWNFGDEARATTDGNGRFVFRGLRPGRFDVSVRQKHKSDGETDGEPLLPTTVAGVATGGPPTTIVVRVGETLRGRIVDQRGAAVAGADVHVGPKDDPDALRSRARRATTAADGSFELRALDDVAYVLTARATGLRTVVQEVRADAKDLRVVLRDGLSIEGVLVDAAGAPIAGRVVLVHRRHHPLPTTEVRAKTDAAGRFVLAGLDEGRTLIEVEGDDRSIPAAPRYAEAGARDVRIAVLALQVLVGDVWEGDNAFTFTRRLPGARIRVEIEGRADPILTVADEDGVFQIGGLPPARCTVHAELPGHEEVSAPTDWPGYMSEKVVLRRTSSK